MRPASCPHGRAPGPSLGHDHERAGLPGGEGEARAPPGARAGRRGAEFAELRADVGSRAAARLGDEPDGDERLDPQVWPRGASAGGRGRRSAVGGGGREFEVGGLAPLRGPDAVEAEGLAGEPAGGTGSSGRPDRRASCRRSRDGGGDRYRRGRREARAGPGRGRDGEHGHGAAERQALAQRRDGAALDRRRPLGGAKDLPPPQGLPPAPQACSSSGSDISSKLGKLSSPPPGSRTRGRSSFTLAPWKASSLVVVPQRWPRRSAVRA